ncbi:MAG: hypothetical protein GY882_00420, partial [Actinomycetia bacterium]|nr:hypothetical protein [Actinomycetes bacterium]
MLLTTSFGCTGKTPEDSKKPPGQDAVVGDSGDSAGGALDDERLVLGEPVDCVSSDSASWTEVGEEM